ncbi:MAG: hypothetical protein PHU63_02260 [Candidatus ainarchaeum sp.]|nr:hypothetical protein [Candidatus ainarchaeum sp.]
MTIGCGTEGDCVGILDSILGSNKEEPSDEVRTSGKPFVVSTKFLPIRLAAMKEGKIGLDIKIKNNTGEKQLVSVDALLQNHAMIGFDPTCINKHVEKRVGEIEPGETKEITVMIWGSNQTKDGEYPIRLTFYSHYLDYKRVLNYMEKTVTVRVV